MAITKFDREMQAMGERAVRQDNINKINAMIADCDDLLAVMPSRGKASFADLQEREFIASRRAWLHEMREDEQKAYDQAGIDFEGLKAEFSKLK